MKKKRRYRMSISKTYSEQCVCGSSSGEILSESSAQILGEHLSRSSARRSTVIIVDRLSEDRELEMKMKNMKRGGSNIMMVTTRKQ